MKEGALEKTKQGEDRPYERSANALAGRAKNALEELAGPGVRAHVYSPVGGRKGVDFLVKFYDNKRSFEAHCSEDSCGLYQVVDNGKALAPITWEGEGGGHTPDDLTGGILREALQRSVEKNKNIANRAVFERAATPVSKASSQQTEREKQK
ncbi:MAG: hypothetical protein AAB916_02385 [Patescibacteria group bacterium]